MRADQQVNVGRQREFDLLKAVTIFLMIGCHVREVFFSRTWEDLAFCNITLGWHIYILIANCLMAFDFMFSMGAMIPFGSNQEAGPWMRRGVRLIFAWFVRNLIIAYPMTVLFAAATGETPGAFFISVCVSNDILILAGSAFIFIGGFRKAGVGTVGTFCAALVLFAIGHFVSWHGLPLIGSELIGNFIVTDDSSFPLLNWLIVPMIGLVWGQKLRHCMNKDWLYLLTGVVGALGTMALLGYAWHCGWLNAEFIARHSSVQVFYGANIVTVMLACLLTAVLLSLCHFITRLINFRWFVAFYSMLSSRLTVIYFCQWIIISWLAIMVPHPTSKVSAWWSVPVTLLVLVMSVAISEVYRRVDRLIPVFERRVKSLAGRVFCQRDDRFSAAHSRPSGVCR